MRPIPAGTVIDDKVHGVSYRIKKRLGAGGFGIAYLAHRLNDRDGERRGGETCLKFTLHSDEWHGEVYFANLLKNVGHVVQMRSAFPAEVRQGRTSRFVFVIDMEYVHGGTVRDQLPEGPWTERQVAFRVRQLLKPLELLHSMGVSHRDITPPNVFVGERKVLKLGDFGITKARLHLSGVRADVANWRFAPPEIERAPWDRRPWWSTADDVYQVGLLMASLLAGEEVASGVRKTEINQLTSRGALRDAIKAAISVKSQRPQDAHQLSRLIVDGRS